MDRIVVTGASAGGVPALQRIIAALPRDFPAAVLIVMHQPPGIRSLLPTILNDLGVLHAQEAREGERLAPGTVHVAVPDHHLMVDRERVHVRRGARENGFRPSVNVLFRSAAHAWGARAIGVVLSGALDDGASGLHAIKALGGLAIVQHPDDAAYSSMPMHAVRRTRVDHVVPAARIGSLLAELVRLPAPDEPPNATELRSTLKVDVAAGVSAWRKGIMGRTSSPYTCPECRGVLDEIREGGQRRFRCHTGHGYIAGALRPRLLESSEDSAWDAVRTIHEAVTLMAETADTLEQAGDVDAAREMRGKIDEANRRLDELRRLSLKGDPAGTGKAG